MNFSMVFRLGTLEHHLRAFTDTDISDLRVISVGYISKGRGFADLISMLGHDNYFKLYSINEFRFVYLSFSGSAVTRILLSTSYPVRCLEGVSAIDFLLETIDEVFDDRVEGILDWFGSNIGLG